MDAEFRGSCATTTSTMAPTCESTKRGRWRQYYVALAANISAMALGTLVTWTATALPLLRQDSSIAMQPRFEGWIGALMELGAAFACPLAGTCIGLIGRKKTMLILVFPFLVGWALIALASNVWMLLVGRFIAGFCAGSFSIAGPVFITEIADVSIRGALTGGFDLMIMIGMEYQLLIGSVTSWRVQSFFSAAIPVVCAVLMIFVPESPTYLVDKLRDEEAVKSLMWLRGRTEASQVTQELQMLKEHLAEAKAAQGSFRDLFKASSLRPISIGLALVFFQQLAGIDAVTFYMVDVFESAKTNIDANASANIVGGIQVFATLIALFIVDKYGRKILLAQSAVFTMLSFAALGAFFYFKEANGGTPPPSLMWLPLTSLTVANIAAASGFGPVPWLMVPEIMPSNIKGVAGGCVMTSRWLWGTFTTLIFTDLMKLFGEAGGYWFFASISLIAVFFVIFFVPETKGKTLHEIQQSFKTKKNYGTSGGN